MAERGHPAGYRRGLYAVLLIALVCVALAESSSQRLPFYGPNDSPAAGLIQRADSSVYDTGAGPVDLSVTVDPGVVCSSGVSTCPAGDDAFQATLAASVGGEGIAAWPATQVLFVLETTPYDGVYNPNSSLVDGVSNAGNGDPCAGYYALLTHPAHSDRPLCDESNGVPFFVANAEAVAQSIASAHPATNVTFGLVDYGATYDQFDDSNGSQHPHVFDDVTQTYIDWVSHWDTGPAYQYHVDVGGFVPAADFGSAVDSTFRATVLGGGYVSPASNLSDNFLHSSSITALYGALSGVGLGWSPNAHNVIVWIGSTAPRDPGYLVNYCMSDSDWAVADFFVEAESVGGPSVCQSNDTRVLSPSCEPAYDFGSGVGMPACFGWVHSQDVNPADSVAGLAAHSPACTQSLGGTCTVDTIDLFALPTDGASLGWVSANGATLNGWRGGTWNGTLAGSWWPKEDAARTIAASCDLALATGGTWDGPNTGSCGASLVGTLLDVGEGLNVFAPNTANPTLFAALEGVGFGTPPSGLVGHGIAEGPMFTFLPFGTFHVALGLPMNVSCHTLASGPTACPAATTRTEVGVTELAWNWSSIPDLNVLYAGDIWSATFYMTGTGPPFNVPLPVDACTAPACTSVGSGSVAGQFSSVQWVPATESPVIPSTMRQSFPPAMVTIEPTPSQQSQGTPGGAPPSGSPPPSVPQPQPSPLVPVTVVPVVAAAIPAVSFAAVAAGALGAGFARVVVLRRGLRIGMPVRAGARGRPSRFER